MKKQVVKKWYRILSMILVVTTLWMSIGVDAHALETISTGDGGQPTPSETEEPAEDTAQDSESDGDVSGGTYTLTYENTYLKTPIETRTNVPLDEQITLPSVSDYVEREGYYIEYLWLWIGHMAGGRKPGTVITGAGEGVSEGGTLTIQPYYQTYNYNISYVLEPVDNDGQPTTDAQNPAVNGENPAKYTVASNVDLKAPQKTGYTFEGWYLDAGYEEKIEKLTPGRTGDITLYAKWRENTYTVLFDGNGGTPEITSQTVRYTEVLTLPDATASESGYRLHYWSLPDTDRTYTAGEKVCRLTDKDEDTVTFTANYSDTFGFITYVLEPLDDYGNPIVDAGNPAQNNAQNGSSYLYGQAVEFLDPVKTGYTFEGWYTDKEYTEKITGISTTDTGDFVVYAKWKENSYTLKLYHNDGTSGVTTISLKYTEEYVLLERERSGYRFVYWNTNKSPQSGNHFSANDTISRMSDTDGETVSFYAIWQKRITKPSGAYAAGRSVYYSRWASTIDSNLVANEDGTFTRVEFYENAVYVENYSAAGKFVDGWKLPMELSIWGGFYSGSQYNFIVFGQSNPDEDDDLEVMRVVRYTKDWKRVDSLAIKAIGTCLPFRAGSLSMTEMNNTLVIHTCREMYQSADGLHHQANTTLFVELSDEKMDLINPRYATSTGNGHLTVNNCAPGYCSHSFNQKVANDGKEVIAVDHGDAYPRAIRLYRYQNADITKSSYVNMYTIPGSTGDNSTGVTLGGVEISSTGYLISANSVDYKKTPSSPYDGQRNIFIAYVPKDHFAEENVSVKWITDYKSDVTVSAPSLLKLGEDQFILLWEESSGQVRYVYLDGEGNKLSEIATLKNTHLSVGEPVVQKEKVVWYYLDSEGDIRFASIGKIQVSFDSMGGTEIQDTFSILSGEKYGDALKREYGENAVFPVPEKTGHKFLGWYTQKEGGKKVTEDTVFSGSFDSVLYAHWEKQKYTVSFDTGCEIECSPITVTYGMPYGELPVVNRFGYEFLGWFSAADEGEQVTDSTIYETDGDSTLFARYKKVYYLTFDGNGGQFLDENNMVTGTTVTISFGVEEVPYAITNVYRKNYALLGWYTEAEGGESFDFSKPLTDHTTVYAHYKPAYVIEDVIASPGTETQLKPGTFVSLTCATAEASIYYFYDTEAREAEGFTPTWLMENGRLYEDPIQLQTSGSLYAVAALEDYPGNQVFAFSYTVSAVEDYWGDVLEEDRAAYEDASQVPRTLWVAGLQDKLFNGAQQKQDIRVYYGLSLLKEKTDYTVTYKNNTKAGVASLFVTGKGCYTGKVEKQFAIIPADIGEASVADVFTVENGKSQRSLSPVSIRLNGKEVKLKKGADYDLVYEDGEYTLPGEYRVIVKGKGNYAGSQTTYRITILEKSKVPMNKVSVGKIKSKEYSDSGVILTEKELVVKYGSEMLLPDRDYTIEYLDNNEIGTATVILKGTGEKYVGEKRVTFKITGISMSKVTVSNLEKNLVYSGKEQLQDQILLTRRYKNAQKESVEETLVPSQDYLVSYVKNQEAGTATIQFTGKGKYTGTIKKTFKINPYDLKEDEQKDQRISVAFPEQYEYTKNGTLAKPIVTYSFEGVEMLLVEGRDYVLSYKNQNVVSTDSSSNAKLPYVTIKGKGNFKGVLNGSKPYYYTIQKKDLSGLSMTVSDVVYKGKAGSCKPVVALYDENGKKLSAGTDYNKTILYTYTEDTIISQVEKKQTKYIRRVAGEAVDKADIIPAGTTLAATVTALDSTKCGYKGSIVKTFRYVEADLAKCKITPAHSFQYHPSDLQFVKSDFVVMNGKEQVESQNYSIQSVVISQKDKKATVTFVGKGKCGGTKKITVKLTAIDIRATLR